MDLKLCDRKRWEITTIGDTRSSYRKLGYISVDGHPVLVDDSAEPDFPSTDDENSSDEDGKPQPSLQPSSTPSPGLG